MASGDVDTLGATCAFLWGSEQVDRVAPPLQFDDVFEFMLRYFGLCLETNPRSEWANSSHSGGNDRGRLVRLDVG
jgi:hypothetical protein